MIHESRAESRKKAGSGQEADRVPCRTPDLTACQSRQTFTVAALAKGGGEPVDERWGVVVNRGEVHAEDGVGGDGPGGVALVSDRGPGGGEVGDQGVGAQ